MKTVGRVLKIGALGGIAWSAYTAGRRSVGGAHVVAVAPEAVTPLRRERPTGSGYGWRPAGGDQEHIGLFGGGLPDGVDRPSDDVETHPGLDAFGRVGDL